MNEETPVVAPEVTETPVVSEEKKETKRPVLDSRRSLTSQVNNLLKAIPEEAAQETEAKVEPKSEVVKTDLEASAKEAAANVEETPDELDLEDIPEETKLDPLPDWSKYILDKLPTIQVLGHEGEDGKDKNYTVKRLEDLPDDFEFSSKRAEIAFTQALASQELNARELLQEYRNQESQRAQRDFEALEAVDIQNDVQSLQRAGLLDKFKYPVNDRRFNDDPAVQESNKIYDFYKELNNQYFNKYKDSGRMYRVSYEDAAYKYYALHPKEAPVEAKPEPKKPEKKPETQVERERVASRVGAPQGAPVDGRNRPLPAGTSLDRIYQYYKNGRL